MTIFIPQSAFRCFPCRNPAIVGNQQTKWGKKLHEFNSLSTASDLLVNAGDSLWHWKDGQMETQAITAETARERDLILAGRRGDELAMETLLHRYHSLLFQAAFRILRNTQDAEDSLQDALVSAYCNLEHFEGRSQLSRGGIASGAFSSGPLQSLWLARWRCCACVRPV